MRFRSGWIALGCLSAWGCGARTADDANPGGTSEGTESTQTTPPDDTTQPSDTTSSDGTQPSDTGPTETTPPPWSAPMNHRAKGDACDNDRPPGMLFTDYGEGAPCNKDEDCTEGINGRCVDRRGPSCTYDECFSDSECDTGGPCGCEAGFWSDYNTCLAGDCQIDTDCGEGNFCSPSFGSCGSYSGVIAYYCRTPEDTCIDDDDCVDPDQGAGYCALFPEVGHWECQYSQCVG